MLFHKVSGPFKGISIFFPTRGTKIVESQVVKILELDVTNKVMGDHAIDVFEPLKHVTLSLSVLQNDAVPIVVERVDNQNKM